MLTDTEVKQKGLGALVEALGEVDTERFIALLTREPFDYTTWQRNIFSKMDIHQISYKAMALRNLTNSGSDK